MVNLAGQCKLIHCQSDNMQSTVNSSRYNFHYSVGPFRSSLQRGVLELEISQNHPQFTFWLKEWELWGLMRKSQVQRWCYGVTERTIWAQLKNQHCKFFLDCLEILTILWLKDPLVCHIITNRTDIPIMHKTLVWSIRRRIVVGLVGFMTGLVDKNKICPCGITMFSRLFRLSYFLLSVRILIWNIITNLWVGINIICLIWHFK